MWQHNVISHNESEREGYDAEPDAERHFGVARDVAFDESSHNEDGHRAHHNLQSALCSAAEGVEALVCTGEQPAVADGKSGGASHDDG